LPNQTFANPLLVDARVADLQKSDWAKNYQINHEGSEIYGNSKAQIFDFGIFDESGEINSQKLFLGDIYSFKMKIHFHDFVDEPILTLTFRDLTGREVAGTNTRNKNIATGKYAAGDIVDIKFEIETRLAPGNYLLTFACSGFEGEEFVVYERLYHILIIEIIGAEQIVGYFDLQAEIEYKKRKGLS